MREGRLRRETVGFPLFVYRAVASVSLRAMRAPRPGYAGTPWKVSLCSWRAEGRAVGGGRSREGGEVTEGNRRFPSVRFPGRGFCFFASDASATARLRRETVEGFRLFVERRGPSRRRAARLRREMRLHDLHQ